MKERAVILIRENPEQMASQILLMIKKLLDEKETGAFLSIALSGGSTPRKIFDQMVTPDKKSVAWEKVRFFWVDERCVPSSDDQSNYKMTRLHLLDPLGIADEQVFRMEGEADPENEAERYAKLLTGHLSHNGGLPQFDLILLGLGEDGHTASIFPGDVSLFREDRTVAVTAHPVNGQKRITLTGPVINNALNVCFIVTGREKAAILSDILFGENPIPYPAALVSPNGGALCWLIDREAALHLDL